MAPMATSVLAATFPVAVWLVVTVASAEVTRLDADATSDGFGLSLTALQISGATDWASVWFVSDRTQFHTSFIIEG